MDAEPIPLYADSVAPVVRANASELFLIRMEARPKPGNPEAADTGGAVVNCWVNADDLRSAELRAVSLIQEEDWAPCKFDSWELVCRECFTADDKRETRETVEEAFREGAICTFFCWPVDAPDRDDV